MDSPVPGFTTLSKLEIASRLCELKLSRWKGANQKRHRRQLFETIERAVERGSSAQRDKAVGQESLFGLFDAGPKGGGIKNEYASVDEWSEKERLSFEKESIGFYVSGHPLYQYEKELKRYARPAV